MKIGVFLAAAMALQLCSGAALGGEPATLKVGEILPDMRLPAPATPAEQAYLGAAADRELIPALIQGELLIIQIFSMYCPICQAEAPQVNRLYALIQKDPRLAGRVKIIGIGAGNSAYEVEYFKKSYHIEFPLFPDEDFTLHKQCGEVRTPFFIGAALKGERPTIVHLHAGRFKDPDDFLRQVAASAGIK